MRTLITGKHCDKAETAFIAFMSGTCTVGIIGYLVYDLHILAQTIAQK